MRTGNNADRIGAMSSKVAGWLAVAVGSAHIVVTTLDRADLWSQVVSAGLWNTFALEASTLANLERSEAFWMTVGSCGVPLLVFGGYVVWSTRHNQRVPEWVGWITAAWGALFAILMPASPAWAVPIIGGLIVIGDKLRKGYTPTPAAA